jgi:hypothetical protein
MGNLVGLGTQTLGVPYGRGLPALGLPALGVPVLGVPAGSLSCGGAPGGRGGKIPASMLAATPPSGCGPCCPVVRIDSLPMAWSASPLMASCLKRIISAGSAIAEGFAQ